MDRGTRVALAVGLIASVLSAQAPSFHYTYWKEEVPLRLDRTAVAVLVPLSAGAVGPIFADLGLLAERWRPFGLPGWFTADLPADGVDDAAVLALVATMAARDVVPVVTPIFRSPTGDRILIAPEIHVGFAAAISPATRRAILEAAAPGELLADDWTGMAGVVRWRCRSGSGIEILAAVNELARRADVRFAEPDAVFTGRNLYVPNDPVFSSAWALNNTGQTGGVPGVDLDAPEAWDLGRGDPGIMVAVIDVGVQQTHPDLNLGPGADFTGEGGGGGPFNACDKHGTAVAGCISAIMDNGIGVVGLAPYCLVASARPFSSSLTCDGSWNSQASMTVAALTWAQSIGTRVTNNSNYYGFQAAAIDQKYIDTRNAGLVHFASAGNNGASSVVYPASISVVNAVSAIDMFGSLANFAGGCLDAPGSSSNYGTGLDFSAPGEDIYTTDRTGADGYVGGDVVCTDGTSFASPYAAAVAALILSRNSTLTAAQVELIMQQSVTDRGPTGYDAQYGHGVVNAFHALQMTPYPVSTLRVSVTAGGSQVSGASSGGLLSSDAAFVAFDSLASDLLPPDGNGVSDVFLVTRPATTVLRASRSLTGGDPDGPSWAGGISADGRWITFASGATNLVLGDAAGHVDVFLRDRLAATCTRVSNGVLGAEPDGDAGGATRALRPAMAPNGSIVVFPSTATNLVTPATNGQLHLFASDRVTGATSLVTIGQGGAAANGPSRSPTVADVGPVVAFESDASNLVATDGNGLTDVFARDLTTGITTRISAAAGGAPANGPSGKPSISADGRFVAFESAATNLVANDQNGVTDVFVFDRQTAQLTRVSTTACGGEGDAASSAPAISGDGRYIAFLTASSNLTGGLAGGVAQIVVKDRLTGFITVASQPTSGGGAVAPCDGPPTLSFDGHYAAFSSAASNLAGSDSNGVSDVFVRDRGPVTNHPLPGMGAVSPSTLADGGPTFTLTVTGSGFVCQSVVNWNGAPIPTTFVSVTQLQAQVAAALIATIGTAAVTVSTPAPGGGTSTAATVTVSYPAPITAAVSPPTVNAGDPPTLITVSGANFRAVSSVRLNGTPVATTFMSTTQLQATIPAASIVASGTVNVTVITPAPGGGTSGAQGVTILNPVPALAAISPTHAAPGTNLTLLATGSSFTANSQVRINGTSVSTTFVSSTQLSALISSATLGQPGSRTIDVFNPAPGGGTSSSLPFTVDNLVPFVIGMSPSSATAGTPGVTLTFTAFNVGGTTVAQWNGAPLPTQFVNGVTVTANVPAALLLAGGTANVTLVNPPPGGGVSAPRVFTVNNPAPQVTNLTPSSVPAGSGALVLTVAGSGFNAQTTATATSGSLVTPLAAQALSPSTLAVSLPATLIAAPGGVALTIANPAPQGGTAAASLLVLAPHASVLTPSLIPPLGFLSPPVTLTVDGTGFLATSVVRASTAALPTTFVSATRLLATLDASVAGVGAYGGLAIAVENGPLAPSNALPLVIGAGSNIGLPLTHPLSRPAGSVAEFRIEGGLAQAPFLLVADYGLPAPLYPWPDPTAALVLGVGPFTGSPGPLVPILDGLGWFGPVQPITFDAQGTLSIPGVQIPAPPLGVTLVLQAIYPDASAPLGIRLTWALTVTL